MIIGINGYAGSGKDTAGSIIQYVTCKYKPCAIEDCLKAKTDFSRYTTWEIKKWAGKLKTIASILTGIPETQFEDQEFKKTDMGPEWNMTVRQFLQRIGTDGLRTGLHENTWVNALMADYIPTQVQWADGPLGGYEDGPLPNWIVTDTRFPNEAQAIKDAGGIVIRIDRPGVTAVNAHPSETALDDWDFDHKIANASDLVSLAYTIQNILAKENII